MNKFKEWIELIINYFKRGSSEDIYVNPLDFLETMDDYHAQAILLDRQRTLRLKLRTERKTVLNGYTPPKPTVANRIDLLMEQAGVVGKEKKDRLGPTLTAVKETKKTAKN